MVVVTTVPGSKHGLLPIYRRYSNNLEHLGVRFEDGIRTTRSPIIVTLRDPMPSHYWREMRDMTDWALLRACDKFERDWNYDACVVVSAMPDLAGVAACTA
jgi:hypothetical protein